MRHLDLQLSLQTNVLSKDLQDVLGQLLRANSCLRHVVLSGRFEWTLIEDQVSLSSSIFRLHLNFFGSEIAEPSSLPDAGSSTLVGKLSNLKQLCLSGFQGFNSGILTLLRECRNLEFIEFKLADSWEPSEESQAELIKLLGNAESMA